LNITSTIFGKESDLDQVCE